jgi:hypothetical protein
MRTGDRDGAGALLAEVEAMEPAADERAALITDLATAAELTEDLRA